MNWYKTIISQQYLEEIRREDYSDEKEYQANRYFSIGQNEDSYCWIWLNGKILTRRGGTHNANFRHLLPIEHRNNNNWHDLYFRGWFDPSQQILSLTLRDHATEVPKLLDNELRRKFGKQFRYEVF